MKLPESMTTVRSGGKRSSSAMVSVRGSIRSGVLSSAYGTARQRPSAAMRARNSGERHPADDAPLRSRACRHASATAATSPTTPMSTLRLAPRAAAARSTCATAAVLGMRRPWTAAVAQVDLAAAALGANRKVDIGVVGDVAAVADACRQALERRGASSAGWRSPELRARIAAEGRWRAVPYADESTPDRIDPRTLTIALDDLLPPDRTVVIDSGNFMGYPSMFLSVPDVHGFCFTQAFQSIGLGLASALGAAVARPDRLTVAALGDGGFLMSIAELSTAVRLGLPLVVVVYNDAAYGAEVHHFGPDGHPLDIVRFPDEDLAAIGRGFGCAGATVRAPGDLAAVADWLAGPRRQPLVVDAKVASSHASWWLEEAFRGH